MSGVSLANIDIGGIATGIGTLAKDLRAAITGKSVIDATKAAELEMKALELEQLAASAQTKVNEIEAASPKLFISGWRPFIGWTCGTALLYHYIIMPFASFAISFFVDEMPALPVLDMAALFTLLLGMLGLGGMRTYERYKGIAREK